MCRVWCVVILHAVVAIATCHIDIIYTSIYRHTHQLHACNGIACLVQYALYILAGSMLQHSVPFFFDGCVSGVSGSGASVREGGKQWLENTDVA